MVYRSVIFVRMMLLSGMADGFLCTRIHLPIPITCVYGKFTVSH